MKGVLIAVILLVTSAAAQDQSFWKSNRFLIAGDGLAKAMDGLYTRRVMSGATVSYACSVPDPTERCTAPARVSEVNPLARPFVKSNVGAVAFFGTEFVGDIAAAYFLQKHGHRKWAKAMLGFGIGYSVEGAAVSAHTYYSF